MNRQGGLRLRPLCVFSKPVGDFSVGEQLYHLRQGKMSIHYYSLKFRTLTAASGWNERSLLTIYQQGLDPRVRLHLAAYNDSIRLECLIQSSSRVTNRMQLCLEEHQGQAPSFFFRQQEHLSTPEPGNEHMQIDSNWLPFTEWQRWLTQRL